jgi:hypothetical protein
MAAFLSQHFIPEWRVRNPRIAGLPERIAVRCPIRAIFRPRKAHLANIAIRKQSKLK